MSENQVQEWFHRQHERDKSSYTVTSPDASNSTIAKSRKRKHHIFNEYELSVLERFYEIQPRLTKSALQILNLQLNLPNSEIENWYKAKASKSKKIKD